MSRVIKSERDVCITVRGERVYLRLIPGGPRRAYLWIGNEADRPVGTVSGEKTLRALALAILHEIGAAP